jgi:dynein heavy chain
LLLCRHPQAVAAVAQRSDMQQLDAVAADVRKLEAQLRAAERQAQTFNSREGVLGRSPTDYSFLKQLADSFDPYMQFWATAADWQVGLTGN